MTEQPFDPRASLRRQLSAGGSAVFAMRAAGMALRFLTILLYARWITGEAQFGAFALGLTWAQVLSVAVEFGLPTAVQRYIPEYIERRDWGHLRGIVRRSDQWVIIHGSALVLLGACSLGAASGRWHVGAAAWTVLALTPMMALANLKRDQLASFMAVGGSHGPPMVVQPTLAVILGWTWHHWNGGYSGWVGLAFYAASWAVVLILQTLLVSMQLRVSRAARPVFDPGWRTTAAPLALVAALFMVLTRTDIIVLGVVRGAAAAGIYAVATRLATLSLLVTQSVLVLVQPTFSRLSVAGDVHGIRDVYRWTSRVGTLAAGALFVGFVVFGRPVLSLFGQAYVRGWLPLCILAAGHTVMAALGPASSLMMMRGLHRRVVSLSAPIVVLNGVLNATLAWLFGAAGAAVATTAANASQNALFLAAVRRHLRAEAS